MSSGNNGDQAAVVSYLNVSRFGDYESLLGLNNTKHASTSLSGVIGELTAVRSTVSDIPQGQERIKIDRHCSWMSPQEHMYLSTRKLMQGILFFMSRCLQAGFQRPGNTHVHIFLEAMQRLNLLLQLRSMISSSFRSLR
ncbi:uncharacterized protein LOC130494233 isoform X2 [Raphanus sativus]|nr:uncharacterized protein LOC108851221 isoform X2 [Raphanus sativus]XP_056855079.1 uncharacterized protein LOC130494233 isoform X2 [Raphanus sativus]